MTEVSVPKVVSLFTFLYTLVVWLYAELPMRYRRARRGLVVQSRCDLPGCNHGGTALPVGGGGFLAEWASRGL